MKELDFINIIKNQIGNEFIGDDCAYLKELGIVVSQDSLIEDVHFKRAWCTPFQLGYKSVTVNISDILAAGADPAYVTIALSLPNDLTPPPTPLPQGAGEEESYFEEHKSDKNELVDLPLCSDCLSTYVVPQGAGERESCVEAGEFFVSEFYRGAKTALRGAKIVGGDITGGKCIVVSIATIGKTEGRKISSRSHAKVGYKIITRGEYGLSSLGLKELMNGGKNESLIKAHLEPQIDEDFSKSISEQITVDYAMMDTSDGLADALFKIAEASNVSIDAKEIDGIFGAEDYHLVAAVPEEFLDKLNDFYIVGDVIERKDYILKIGERKFKEYDELGLYNHFGENI